VDERSETVPEHFSGRYLLEAEGLVRDSRARAVSLRLGGIYGPGRARLMDSVRAGPVTLSASDDTVTNRIHRDDCTGALAHLMTLPNPAPIYVGVDHEPASRRTLLTWLTAELGLPEPLPAADLGTNDRRARSNKRCDSALLRKTYEFRYPTFREGYRALLGDAGSSPR
jgi:nucleoside-diphosphate-sugar epimerase